MRGRKGGSQDGKKEEGKKETAILSKLKFYQCTLIQCNFLIQKAILFWVYDNTNPGLDTACHLLT